MATTTKKPAQATKKDNTAPAKKAPAKQTTAQAKTEKHNPVVITPKAKEAPAKADPKKPAPTPVMASAPTKNTAADVKARKAETPKAKEAPAKAAPAKKAEAPKAAPAKKVETPAKKAEAPKAAAKTTSTGKTAYHVSKRDNDGREWKVFIQGSDKVIKLFKTQAEALDYAKSLAKNKDDGSYVILHGLDGKIRRF